MRFAWAAGRGVEIPSSPIADAILAGLPDGSGERVVASIDADLVPTLATVAVERRGDGHWRVGGREIRLDEAGVPAFAGGEAWPLEEPGVVPD